MKTWVKWIGRILLGILVLLIILILSIHTAVVKRFVRDKVQNYLGEKTHTEVHITAINYRLPKWVELDGVFMRDKAGDTLLYGNKVRVDVDMFKLISGKVQISRIEMDKVLANVYRKPNDSTYNFQFLIDAFAGKPSAQPEPAKQSRVSLSLDEVELTGCAFRWKDRYGGMMIETTIGNFKAQFDSIDLYTTTALVNKFSVKDMRFDMQMIRTPYNLLPKPVEDTIKKAGFPVVHVKRMDINSSHFSFSGEEQGISTVNDIGDLTLRNLAMSADQQISTDNIDLLNSFLSVDRTALPKKVVTTVATDTIKQKGFTVNVGKLHFYNNNIAYNDRTVKKAASGLDPAHLIVRSFSAAVSGIGYNSQQIKAKVDSLSLIEKSGFRIDTLHGNIDMRDTVIYAKNLLLKTPSSRIAGDALIYPASFAAHYKGNQQNSFSFRNNIIASKDIELLVPSVAARYRKQLAGVSTVYVTADGSGNTKKMLLKTVSLHSNKNDINILINGTLWNATSPKELVYDMTISKAVVSKSFIDPFVNTGGKQTVNFPPSISINGKVRGDMRQLTSDLAMTSAYGRATLKGSVKNFTDTKKLGYNIQLVAKELETGKWINKDSLLGKVNGTVMINGSGIDYKTASLQFSIDLNSFRLQQHVYTGINFKGKGNQGVYDVKGGIKDSLLRLNMDVNTALNQKYPTAVGKISVENADLFALGFYKDPFSFRSDIDIQAKNLTPEGLDALIRMDSTVVHTDNKTFRVDSVLARGVLDSGKTLLTLRSPFADATVKGEFRYDELPGVLQNAIAKYTRKNGNVAPVAQPATLDLAVDLKQDPIYALLLPGLFFDKNIHATGRIDTKQKDSTLFFYITAPVVAYNTNRLSKLDARITGVNDSLRYAIMLDSVHASSLLLYTTSITGGIGKGNYSASFLTKDTKKKDKYSFGITAATDGDAYRLHLADTLKLNYENWNVDTKNQVVYSPQGINISQFAITKGNESIAINSSSPAPNAPMDIKIDNFSLKNITGLLDRDSLEIAGQLDAQVKIEGLDKKVPLFNGNAKIDSLAYQGQSVGNLAINAKSEGEQGVAFDGGLTGNGNNVTLKGVYDQDKIDAKIDLAPIELKAIQPFTAGQLTRSSGKATGSIAITGPVSAPEWNGSIRFDSAFTQLAKYGTVLKLSGAQIDMKYPEITLNSFTIKDSLDHPLVINGTLRQENGTFNTDLTIKTRNFYALNNSAVANDEIYGTAIVDVDVAIKGPATAPDITGKVGLKENSQVTYVRQQNIANGKDREKVMEFVDMDTIKNLVFKPTELAPGKKVAETSMLNYALDIDIDKNARFSVIIDPITRDELMVQGSGQITAGVQPNGDISLTGAYNLTKGSYQLNYKFLKRKFDLQEGSTIVLSGDPMNAEANITAIYNIDAVPYDLIANEVSDQTTSDVYKQKLPFQVLLQIKGKVLQPEITFDIQLSKANGINSEMQNTIDNKFIQMRSDASTMNKQVFALLVMGRFIGEQSKDFFASSSGDGLKADAVVKESVSRFLSDAVSQIAADLIKGVDVDVNLKTVDNYTDQSQRTDLNLALSKRFLNDRLNISVGKSFTVDGEDPLAKGQDNNNVSFLPDITTTYKLSKDGRYMLKAYQKSDYEAILDGYFIETGVAFTLTMDYNRFKELFEKKKRGKKSEGQKKGPKTDQGMGKTVAEKSTDKNEDKK